MALRHILPVLFLAMPAHAESVASDDALRAALAGNTVQGSMLATGGYAEYYAPDGTIHAADYTGTWAIRGGKICFAYGDDPASCWAAVISGSHVVWISEAGEEGSGTITAGNPSGW